MAGVMNIEDRIIELEMRIAHQDRTIADLDEVVREFADRVAGLEQEVKELRAASRDSAGIGSDDGPPPHY
jgi:SlyX protein